MKKNIPGDEKKIFLRMEKIFLVGEKIFQGMERIFLVEKKIFLGMEKNIPGNGKKYS